MFIPNWILLCLAIIAILYAVALAIVLLRSPDVAPEHKQNAAIAALGYSAALVPLLVFLVRLVSPLLLHYLHPPSPLHNISPPPDTSPSTPSKAPLFVFMSSLCCSLCCSGDSLVRVGERPLRFRALASAHCLLAYM